MAFCTNCGKSLGDGARFCTNCGTPVQAPAQSPAVASGEPSNDAPAAMSTAPDSSSAPVLSPPEPEVVPETVSVSETHQEFSAPPVETPAEVPYADLSEAPQSSISPVFVIICVVLVLLIAGGIAGTVYLQKQGKAKAAPQQAESQPAESVPETASTPAVTPATAPAAPAPETSATESTTSVPAPSTTASAPANPAPAPASTPAVADSIRAMNLGNYPGATPVAIATLTGETVVAGFLTRDSPQQVMQYYKIRFPVSATSENEGKAELRATLPDGTQIRIQAQPQGTNTQVMVLQEK